MGWQAAMLNERYFDLAVAASFLLSGDADESTYLERYFGQPPDEYRRARFFLMRQVVHMLSATVFLLLGSAGEPVDQSESVPSFEDFHRGLWAGALNLADKGRKIAYGRVHWEALSRNVRSARFEEALGIVAARNRSQGEVRLLLPSAP
jgi:hypothetical protein